MSAVQISAEALEVLGRATVNNGVVRLPPGQLPRPVYTAVDKALTALGGRWCRKSGGHVFGCDPTERLAEAISSGAAFDEARGRVKTLQLFETPPDLAERLVARLQVTQRDRCLEPSAGLGRILKPLSERSPEALFAVELDPANAREIQALGMADNVFCQDFLTFDPLGDKFTAVAMNPPFRGNQDIRHVRHAFNMLAPGGRLGAIVSEHGFIGGEREAVEWRQWLRVVAAEVEEVPAGTFKESGTKIATRMVFLRRNAA